MMKYPSLGRLYLLFSLLLVACKTEITLLPETSPASQSTVTISSPAPSATPTPDYRELSEKELALLIHESVVDMEAAAKTAVITMTDATSENLFTSAEISQTTAHIHTVQSTIYFINDLVHIYVNIYDEIAYETIDLLIAIDEQVNKTAIHSNNILSLLDKEDATSTSMDQIKNDAALLEAESINIQMQSGNWLLAVQTQIEEREKYYATIPPQSSQVYYNRVDAFIQAHDFLDTFTTALSDGKISQAELTTISQLGANAKSSLYNTGDPQLIDIARQIKVLTGNASRGEWMQATEGLSAFHLLLPARPRP